MARKKGKSVSFDAMVKFFMHNYNIPTKTDIDRLNDRLDQIERLIIDVSANRPKGAVSAGSGKKRGGRTRYTVTAADKVLTVVKTFKDGASFADIKRRTGFDDKKLRNIIFRLNKTGKIKRKSRGVYIAV